MVFDFDDSLTATIQDTRTNIATCIEVFNKSLDNLDREADFLESKASHTKYSSEAAVLAGERVNIVRRELKAIDALYSPLSTHPSNEFKYTFLLNPWMPCWPSNSNMIELVEANPDNPDKAAFAFANV